MGVEDLRKLSRDELASRAGGLGVHRPSTLTKAELVDEIVRRSTPADTRAKVRGWLGVARDLVARVIDRGLHLPEAAQLFRGAPAPSVPKPPPPLPTVTLAEIYGAQGYYARAVGVLNDVLAREPDHAEARALRERFAGKLSQAERDELIVHAAAPVADEVSEPAVAAPIADEVSEPAVAEVPHPAGGTPEPSHYDVDEVVALPTDPHTAYVYWELRPMQLARARYADPSGRLVLRVLSVAARGMNIEQVTRDVAVDQLVGDRFLRGLMPACELRLCIGWFGDKGFLPLVIAPEMKMPRDEAGGEAAATFNGTAAPGAGSHGVGSHGVGAPSGGLAPKWAEQLSKAAAASPVGGTDAPSRAAARRLRGYLAQLAGGEALPLVEWTELQTPPVRGGASDLYQGRAGQGRAGQRRAELGRDGLGGASDLSQIDAKPR